MADRARILLLSRDPRRLVALLEPCTALGYDTAAAHMEEEGGDALARTAPHVVLVDLQHPAAESHTFLAMASTVGARVVLLGPGVEHAHTAGVVAFGNGVAPMLTAPETNGLAPLLARALGTA